MLVYMYIVCKCCRYDHPVALHRPSKSATVRDSPRFRGEDEDQEASLEQRFGESPNGDDQEEEKRHSATPLTPGPGDIRYGHGRERGERERDGQRQVLYISVRIPVW